MAKKDLPDLGAVSITPAQRATIERTVEALMDGARAADLPADVFVGGDPTEREEREAILDAASARDQDQQSSATERRVQLLEEQLRETNAMLVKLAREKGGYTAGIAAIDQIQQERQRRLVYERISRNGGFATISVHTHEDPSQNIPVYVGWNGRSYSLPRGEPVVVPVGVIEILDHAKTEGWVPQVNANGDSILVPQLRMSYPYSLLDYSGQRPELQAA